MQEWLQALLWGLLSGGALVIGAGIGYLRDWPPRLVAAVMAFGSGVLVSALAFGLVDEAFEKGGAAWTGAGFLAGALVFTAANVGLCRLGAHHRKRSGEQQASEESHEGSGLAIAIGSLLDGIPESIVIGVSLIGGGGVSLVAVAAVFLSNLPEGLSSAAGMRKGGRSAFYVFGIWGAIALLSGIASLAGYLLFRDLPPTAVAATQAIAAGAILAMLSDTMIPEAYEGSHELSGLVTALGFLLAFGLDRLHG